MAVNRDIRLLLLSLIVLLSACRDAEHKEAKPVVTVSIPPQEFLLKVIVGDDMEINTMLPPGTDAETYEPSIKAMRNLEKSSEYAMVGTLPFEQSLRKSLGTMYPSLHITDARSKFFLLSEEEAHETDGIHEHEEEHGHHAHNHEEDPHVWATPRNIRAMADALLEVAIRVNPSHEDLYRKNHNALIQRIDSLQRSMERDLEPLKGKEVAIWHPSLVYMAHDFGFRQLSVQQGHKEPTPRRMAQAVDETRKHNVVALVVEAEHSPRMALNLNADMKLPVVKTSLMQPDIISSLSNLAKDLGNAAKSM